MATAMIIEKGNMVKLMGTDVYGTVVWIEGEKAHTDYYSKQQQKYVTELIPLVDLVKIGSHPRIITRNANR